MKMEAKNSHIIIGDANDGTTERRTDADGQRRMHDTERCWTNDATDGGAKKSDPKSCGRPLRRMDGAFLGIGR